jgi:hypothetical protein
MNHNPSFEFCSFFFSRQLLLKSPFFSIFFWHQSIVERVEKLDPIAGIFTPDMAEDFLSLWGDPSIQKTFDRQNEFQLADSTSYFFAELNRLASPNYHPNNNDVLHCRAKTTGIIETQFEMETTKFM